MNKKNLTRRQFLTTASVGTVAAVTSGGIGIYGNTSKKAAKLAIHGGQPIRSKPFPAWPKTDEFIEKSLVSTFRGGKWCRIDGGANMVATFEKKFAELMGTKRCLATGSGTQALHTSLHSVGVDAGDEVLVTPCTFIASVQVIFLCNALPVFVDVDLETFQIDPDKMEALINENTKAVEPVHISGLPANMDKINAIAKKHNLNVVEDACHAPLAKYKGKKCGTLGDLGCFSFQSSKTLPCGEGGAVIGNDEELMDKCFTFHNIGMPAKTKNSIMGPKYRMNEFEASVLIPQLMIFEEQVDRRNENAKYLTSRLKEMPGIIPQKPYEGTTKGGYYLYGFRYKKEKFNNIPRNKFLKA
ncbi:MAG: DegT/DnrJ/EryC1/StrS family aminotransferase, partial [Candidatus Helarchaeota archaeon]|nr:DegT/DnrJ/EryC1/StrS family aminotransferase [Candidatus Helarchaeota archaeon]